MYIIFVAHSDQQNLWLAVCAHLIMSSKSYYEKAYISLAVESWPFALKDKLLIWALEDNNTG